MHHSSVPRLCKCKEVAAWVVHFKQCKDCEVVYFSVLLCIDEVSELWLRAAVTVKLRAARLSMCCLEVLLRMNELALDLNQHFWEFCLEWFFFFTRSVPQGCCAFCECFGVRCASFCGSMFKWKEREKKEVSGDRLYQFWLVCVCFVNLWALKQLQFPILVSTYTSWAQSCAYFLWPVSIVTTTAPSTECRVDKGV